MGNLWFAVFLLFLKVVHVLSGAVAQGKCNEYGKAVYALEDSPTMVSKPGKDKVSQCAIASVPLIVGGVRAGEKEFPHMALIGFGSGPSWDCGGSLISDVYVLTAAHCLTSQGGPASKVKLGVINKNSAGQVRSVARAIKHPQYKPPEKYHDIALIKMSSPVKFTAHIRPACLNSHPISQSKALASGFGKNSHEASSGTVNLMKVQLSFISHSQCQSSYSSDKLRLPEGINDGIMLCAGEMRGGKDTCQGDSGGPLQVVLKNPYCMYSIVGVTSFGKFCGFKGSPSIYTRVSYYVPWIEGIVWR